MTRDRSTVIRIALIALALSSVAGCDGGEQGKSDSGLNAKLVNNDAAPAAQEANDTPPPATKGKSAIHSARKHLSQREAQAEALRLAGGTLMSTPTATKSVSTTKAPKTLADKAEGEPQSGCAPARITYAMDWADRMPADFPLYPGATVTEAAGADNIPCNIRAVSFTTPVPVQQVMDFYYTMAHRRGYSVEHREENGSDVLGGTRNLDDGAYYVSLGPAPDGGTAVDLIANGGR